MTFFDWLASPAGVDLVHALSLLLIAAASWLTFLTHRRAKENAKLLNSHLEQHVLDTVQRTWTAEPPTLTEPPPGSTPSA